MGWLGSLLVDTGVMVVGVALVPGAFCGGFGWFVSVAVWCWVVVAGVLRWARVLVARVLPLCPLYVRCIAVAAWVSVASAFRKAV